jgi:hypothetical protein
MKANRPNKSVVSRKVEVPNEDNEKIEPEELALLKEDQNNFTESIENQLSLSVHCYNEKMTPADYTEPLSMSYTNYIRVHTSDSAESTRIAYAQYQEVIRNQRKAMQIAERPTNVN